VVKTIPVVPPLQKTCVLGVAVTVGVGRTVTTKVNGRPTQNVVEGPVGVIIYVTDPLVVPELIKSSFMAPEPLALNPITLPEVNEAVHAKVVPETAEVGV